MDYPQIAQIFLDTVLRILVASVEFWVLSSYVTYHNYVITIAGQSNLSNHRGGSGGS
jgi:hypothetical protein